MNQVNPLRRELYYGDNLDVLRTKIAPNSVDLCYIDPPFSSDRDYFQIYNNIGKEDLAQAKAFVDTWEWEEAAEAGFDWLTNIDQRNSNYIPIDTIELIKGLEQVLKRGSLLAYLVSMTLRLIEIHRVLKPTGSFYLHCDPTASHYLKILCDSIYCRQGGEFRNEIVWCYRKWSIKQNQFVSNHDVILFYTKSKNSTFNVQFVELSKGTLKRWKGKKQIAHFDESGRRISSNLEEDSPGSPMSDWWEIAVINSQAKERLGYQTQKPKALLERIIKASSNEGDVVLDAYCGCGTTVAVAERLNRHWIGIDITYQSIGLILKRLQDSYPDQWLEIESTLKLDGIPRDLDSALALANRKDDKTRKEFEKWAILTYCQNQARINEKKGADGGVDGIAYFFIDSKTNGKAIFQVKSGGANRATLSTLNSDRLREKAEFGFLITTELPTKAMREEITAAGKYRHPSLNREDDRLQIVTLAEIFQGKRLNLPMMRKDVVKSAKSNVPEELQKDLEFEFEFDSPQDDEG